MNSITLALGWVVAIFIAIIGGMILYKIITNEINLKNLISEKDGSASLSRFQLLIFTFVISTSLFMIIIHSTPLSFPEIPYGIFTLLGISSGAYVISKGIQKTAEVKAAKTVHDDELDDVPPMG